MILIMFIERIIINKNALSANVEVLTSKQLSQISEVPLF